MQTRIAVRSLFCVALPLSTLLGNQVHAQLPKKPAATVPQPSQIAMANRMVRRDAFRYVANTVALLDDKGLPLTIDPSRIVVTDLQRQRLKVSDALKAILAVESVVDADIQPLSYNRYHFAASQYRSSNVKVPIPANC